MATFLDEDSEVDEWEISVGSKADGAVVSDLPLPKDILAAMTNTVPLANLMDGQIGALRHWAKGRAREAAARSVAPARNGRRMSQAN